MSSSNTAPVCRFFVLHGNCWNGDECPFSHQVGADQQSLEQARKSVPCRFYLRGNCRYGDRCLFLHQDASTSSNSNSSTNQEASLKCGICLEDPLEVHHKFGLQTNCDHVFCFECLMEWRTEGSREAADRRVCPECRAASAYVLSSPSLAIGPQKQAIMDGILARRAATPCKQFNGSLGSCLFGKDCFYAHFDENGRDIKDLDESMQALHSKRTRKRRSRSDLDFVTLLLLRDLMMNAQQSLPFDDEDNEMLFGEIHDAYEELMNGLGL